MPKSDKGSQDGLSRRDARPSENGKRPAGDSEFSRFARLTKRLVSVPKKEIEKQAKKPR